MKTEMILAEAPVLESLEEVYEELFPAVAAFVAKTGGSLDDARDVFHDAMIIFYEKTGHGSILIRQSPAAYIMGIVKHLWYRQMKIKSRHASGQFVDQGEIPSDFYPESWLERLHTLVASAGERCLQLLTAFYYEREELPVIAGKFGFQSTRSATVQKFKCLEKVRNKVKEKSLSYEDFVS